MRTEDPSRRSIALGSAYSGTRRFAGLCSWEGGKFDASTYTKAMTVPAKYRCRSRLSSSPLVLPLGSLKRSLWETATPSSVRSKRSKSSSTWSKRSRLPSSAQSSRTISKLGGDRLEDVLPGGRVIQLQATFTLSYLAATHPPLRATTRMRLPPTRA